MFSMQRILAPVDFSERSVCAARYAHVIARRFGSKVTLLHVLPPPHYEFSSMEVGGTAIHELFEIRTTQVRAELESFVRKELPDLQAERVLLEGDPAGKIIEFAREDHSDLIVVPTHGYGTFRRFILGSVTAKILHDADCPVWTGVHVQEGLDAGRIDFRTIVAAVDLGPQSEKTLAWAAAMASAYESRLMVIHAPPCIEGQKGEYHDQDWQRNLTGEVKAEIGKLLGKLSLNAEILIHCGDAPEVVCSEAKQAEADLLVIGRGSAAGVFGRLRANAYSIIRQSPCPVVSV